MPLAHELDEVRQHPLWRQPNPRTDLLRRRRRRQPGDKRRLQDARAVLRDRWPIYSVATVAVRIAAPRAIQF